MHTHQQKIIEQFTQQAVPFTQISGHHDAIDLLIDLAHPTREDFALDVACGPGIVSIAFAHRCQHMIGLDVTPAMIELAQQRQVEQGITNITWKNDTCLPLPFDDSTFSLVITRYSFHHFHNPGHVLKEMIRVCRPGGKIVVADVVIPTEKAPAFDHMETIRDPSHVHALTSNEFEQLFGHSELQSCCRTHYDVKIELEAQIKASFPLPGDEERLRIMITNDIGENRLGIDPKLENDQVWYTIPIAVYMGIKKAKKNETSR